MAVDSATTLAWLQRSASKLREQRNYLTELDAAIGDADHGANMDRGFTAVMAKLEAEGAPADVGAILKTVGATLVSTVGGASGPLYGTAFLRAGMTLASKTALEPGDIEDGLQAALEGIKARGKAHAGEKTMIDALEPAVQAYSAALAAGQGAAAALTAAANAAEEGMRATIPMLATKGRASYLGERSIGHQDPGATSCALLLRAAAGEG
ncbi:MAG TPA: dihydroxyacetone kinase subunit DhaL [Ktedonobacterales bacterium]|jgi:dihydroxyacetone kinase-like protein|nr:dihydroxyacetone kinase subunit DhaL [Ktedonobacterales bacterium]